MLKTNEVELLREKYRLTQGEVAWLIGRNRVTLARWLSAGIIPESSDLSLDILIEMQRAMREAEKNGYAAVFELQQDVRAAVGMGARLDALYRIFQESR